jgi:hypothetical protein
VKPRGAGIDRFLTALALLAAAALAGCSGTVPAAPAPGPTATPGSGISVSPSKLTFTGNAPQTVRVSQPNYGGAFSQTNTCATIAKAVWLSNAGGSAKLQVTPLAAGKCAVSIAGGGGASASVKVDVSPNPIVVTPSNLDFTQTGPDAKRPVEVNQSEYGGTFSVKDDCAGIASIAVGVNAHGVGLFSVTPLGKGTCTATFTGGVTTTAPLAITVTPPGGVTVAPSSLAFTQTGSGAAKKATVTQSGYTGSYKESDDCGGIASVALAGNQRGKATYKVTPSGAGTCVAVFTGGRDETGRLSISVKLPGSVSVSPSSMTFNELGSSAARDANVSQKGYGGTFTESDDCSGKATIAKKSDSGGKATYSVTAVAAGSCTATFAGGNGEKGTLAVTIAPYGSVVVAPASMSFTATGSGAAKNASVTQTNFTGSFGESDTCASVATVAASSNADGQAEYRVTPLAAGTCTATFTGGGGATAPLKITVAPYGNVQVAPSSLTFNATGSGAAQQAKVSQSGYTGSFTEGDDCATTATVSFASNGSGKATVTVTPLAAGACTATFTGGNQATAPLEIVVDLPGGVVASPSPLNFALGGSAQGTTVTVTQPKYAGTFTEKDTCSGIAKVVQLSNAGGTAHYRVTPVAVGICSIVFTGGNAETFDLHVSVTKTNVVINGRRKP